ncbi:dynamin family protein [Neogemmobacter tilapiae]|uniref:Dynamin N-terminal domain-containing protein n=1 Tax=Neogemmobacter tilapiae TaxID=875041 RepID=A0A918TXL9_9RHOB|nr:dynamin family protein [Gemmobacter tilapiae]GHC66762.1 hypothetical protein GCM10007315_34590 [Gemmobacter tilapiae]
MTTPLETELVTTELNKFLSDSTTGHLAEQPGVGEARAQAEALVKRLAAPVRLMIAGEFSSGKSTLTNLLVGEQLIPTGVLASPLPPVVFRYGTTLTSQACWWDGRDPQVFDGADFSNLMDIDPDYIVLTAPNPFLRNVTIFDTPGTSDPDREGEVLVELSGRAEMVIWCTNAVQAWRESERHTWFQLSPNVLKHGLLAVTHVDLPSVKQGYARIMSRLEKEAGDNFHAILPIDTPTAIDAAPKGVVKDAKSWADSGGQKLFDGIHKVAEDIRQPEVVAARELMVKTIQPLVAKAAVAEQRAATPQVAAAYAAAVEAPVDAALDEAAPKKSLNMLKAAVAAANKTELRPAGGDKPAKINPLAGLAKLKGRPTPELDDDNDPFDAPLPDAATTPTPVDHGPAPAARLRQKAPTHRLISEWQKKIDALIALIAAHDDIEESGFAQAASDTVMEVIDQISSADITKPDTEWLFGQFQEALDTVILMTAEPGEGPLEDSAILLLQLSRDLSRLTQSVN